MARVTRLPADRPAKRAVSERLEALDRALIASRRSYHEMADEYACPLCDAIVIHPTKTTHHEHEGHTYRLVPAASLKADLVRLNDWIAANA